jgi:hypothetical protein
MTATRLAGAIEGRVRLTYRPVKTWRSEARTLLVTSFGTEDGLPHRLPLGS